MAVAVDVGVMVGVGVDVGLCVGVAVDVAAGARVPVGTGVKVGASVVSDAAHAVHSNVPKINNRISAYAREGNSVCVDIMILTSLYANSIVQSYSTTQQNHNFPKSGIISVSCNEQMVRDHSRVKRATWLTKVKEYVLQ